MRRPGAIRWSLVLIALAGALSAAAAILLVGSPVQGSNPDHPQLVDRGRQVYQRNCASCHGVNLEGQPGWKGTDSDGSRPAPPHDESGHTWHHPDAVLFRIVDEGGASVANGLYKSNMPAFGGGTLSDEEIWAVLSYIKSRWPADIRRLHDEMNRQAQ